MPFFEPFTVTERRFFLGCLSVIVILIGYGVGSYNHTISAQRFIPARPNSEYVRDRHVALDTKTGEECWTGPDERQTADSQAPTIPGTNIPDYVDQVLQPAPPPNAGLPLCRHL
jgi:hypothetical protein